MKLQILLTVLAMHGNKDMKLVNTKTGFVMVEFQNGNACFYDPFLEAELKDRGILIPPVMKDQFEGKRVVFPGDALFEKAFVEVYYRLVIPNMTYQWQKD